MKIRARAAIMCAKRFTGPALLLSLLLSCSSAARRKDVAAAGGDGGDQVVAVVNGREITAREVDERAGEQARALQGKLYQLRKTALNKYIGELLIEEEARSRGVTVEELRRQLAPDSAGVRQEQVDEIYMKHSDKYANMTEAEAKQKIRAAMENNVRNSAYERFVADLRSKGKVELLLREPAAPVVTVNVSDAGPSMGGAAAPVTLVEFSDFQCPACKRSSHLTRQLAEAYGDRLKIVFKHLPLPIHDQAFRAAQAAFCAGEQGKFWEYHDALFDSADLSGESFARLAGALSLDPSAFQTCLDSEASRNAVLKDQKEARDAGIRGTPTFVLNGTLVRGARSFEEFRRLIDEQLR